MVENVGIERFILGPKSMVRGFRALDTRMESSESRDSWDEDCGQLKDERRKELQMTRRALYLQLYNFS